MILKVAAGIYLIPMMILFEPDNRPSVEELFRERGMLWPRRSPSRYNWRRRCLEGECGGQELVARAVRLLALGNLSDALLNGVSMVPSPRTLSAAIDLMYEWRVVSWDLFHFDWLGRTEGDVLALVNDSLVPIQEAATCAGFPIVRGWDEIDGGRLMVQAGQIRPRWSQFGLDLLREPGDCFRRFLCLFGRTGPYPIGCACGTRGRYTSRVAQGDGESCETLGKADSVSVPCI
jgi:hypothetical protein